MSIEIFKKDVNETATAIIGFLCDILKERQAAVAADGATDVQMKMLALAQAVAFRVIADSLRGGIEAGLDGKEFLAIYEEVVKDVGRELAAKLEN